MCLLDLVLAKCLMIAILVAHAMLFFAFVIISFGLSLICIVIVNLIFNESEINSIVWAIGAIIVLSYITEGLFFGYSYSLLKVWMDQQKKDWKCILVTSPLFIYFLLFCGAISQLYFQHKMFPQFTTANFTAAGQNSSTGNTIELIVPPIPSRKGGFSLLFLLSISYFVFVTASCSDWLEVRSQSAGIRSNFTCSTVYECLSCIFIEILNNIFNLLLLIILVVPVIVETFEFPPICIMLSGLGIAGFAALLKLDKACPQFETPTFSINKHKLYAKNLLLTHIWYPLLIFWFMKDQRITIFTYEMSERQDFAAWASLVSVTLLKTVRNLNLHCEAPRTLSLWDNRVGDGHIDGGDKDGGKKSSKHRETTRSSSSESETVSPEPQTKEVEKMNKLTLNMADVKNNNARLSTHRENSPPLVHQFRPSAPLYEEIDEVPSSKQWKTTIVRARPSQTTTDKYNQSQRLWSNADNV